MSQATSSHLPSETVVLRADAGRIPFSPTSTFRFVSDGGPGVPDLYEEHASRGDGPPLHRHPWPSWELVLSGKVRVVIDGRELLLSSGDAVYIPPGAAHSYVIESERAHTIGVNLSDGRFSSLQREAAKVFAAPGGPDMGKIMALAAAHGVEVLGPPLTVTG